MTNRVTWDDNFGNAFDNVANAVEGTGNLIGDAFNGAVSKAKNALDTFMAICNTNSSLGTTNEQVLTEIANSPHWTVSNAPDQEREANQAVRAVDKVSKQIEASPQFEGEAARKATEYGTNIVNMKYDEVTANQASIMRQVADQANSVIDYVRDHRDDLPGGKLDQQSTDMLNGVRNVVVHIPVLNTIIDTAGWSDPVGKINMFLGNNREKEAGKLLEETRKRFGAISSGVEPVALPAPPIPPVPDPDDDTRDDHRIPGPGTYLGDGAYDLNGDGNADYYDYNLDGVPDVWVDSDGDGIPDIYDTYDDNDPNQRRTIEDATEQVRKTIINNHDSAGGSVNGSGNGSGGGANGGGANSGNGGNGDYWNDGGSDGSGSNDGGTGQDHGYYDPQPGTYPPTPDPYDPSNPPSYNPYDPNPTYPYDPYDPGDGPIDVDSGMGGGIPGSTIVPPHIGGGVGGSYVGGGVGGSYGGAGLGGVGFGAAGLGGLAAGTGTGYAVTRSGLGGSVTAGAAGGSYFTNTPVSAQIVPGGLSGQTGMAAGLKAAGAEASASANGRSGMMGAPGAGTANNSKNKRQRMGYVAPKLEDDDIAIRSVGAMAGHRVKKSDQ